MLNRKRRKATSHKMRRMASVSLENISKIYPNGVAALRGLNLDIQDGELLVLVGPSGSGKTTALRLIAGLEQPSTGTIRIGGRRVNEVPSRERDVAMVFQRHTLYPHLTVRRNLSFGLELRRPSLARRLLARLGLVQPISDGEANRTMGERIAEAAQFLELQDLLDRRPNQLSGGQQQRAALGRALVRRSAVFLLDEPLSNLDVPLRSSLRRQLHLLHRRFPATMIYVTHDPVEAMILADRVAVVDEGVVWQVDQPTAVYEKPGYRRVAAFFGWPSMNLLDGVLSASDNRWGLRVGDTTLPLPGLPQGDWQPRGGQALTLGIRPHDLHLSQNERVGLDDLVMEVRSIEALGNFTLVTLRHGDLELTAQVDGRQRIAAEHPWRVMFDMDRTHWFDRGATGRRLAGGRPEG
jgi:multiple sugar transport system ATP-binding protein